MKFWRKDGGGSGNGSCIVAGHLAARWKGRAACWRDLLAEEVVRRGGGGYQCIIVVVEEEALEADHTKSTQSLEKI